MFSDFDRDAGVGQINVQGYMEDDLLVGNTPLATAPIRLRPQTSDLDVYCQIFVEREYACLDDVLNARLIIDCGANIGCSAAYFLSRFPTCELIAVEPEPANYELLCKNLAPYGKRVRTLCTGVWSHAAQLVVSERIYRDGRAWARQVRECAAGETGSFEAVDVGTLLEQSQYERISILKIDVEGAEAVIFAENYESWIDRVDNLVIELHDDSVFGKASDVFLRAISGRPFLLTRSGELVVCRRMVN